MCVWKENAGPLTFKECVCVCSVPSPPHLQVVAKWHLQDAWLPLSPPLSSSLLGAPVPVCSAGYYLSLCGTPVHKVLPSACLLPASARLLPSSLPLRPQASHPSVRPSPSWRNACSEGRGLTLILYFVLWIATACAKFKVISIHDCMLSPPFFSSGRHHQVIGLRRVIGLSPLINQTLQLHVKITFSKVFGIEAQIMAPLPLM